MHEKDPARKITRFMEQEMFQKNLLALDAAIAAACAGAVSDGAPPVRTPRREGLASGKRS
jgi:hypothetical protein